MRRSFAQRTQQAFSGEDGPSRARNYLGSLHASMKDIADAEKRSVFLSILVAFTFELFNRAAISNVQIGPFEIRDLSLVHKCLPVLFAYLMYDLMVLGVRYVQSHAIHTEIVRRFDRRLSESGLDLLLLPQESSLFGPTYIPSNNKMGMVVKLLTVLLTFGTLILPLFIEGYMLIRLFDTFGKSDFLVWSSAIFAIGFFAYSIAIFPAALLHRRTRLETKF
jgi:hypothetical protein